MITAERLRELIKQGATIWYGRSRWGYPIKLDTKHFIIINGILRYHKNKTLIGDGYESKDLREDVDRGKWEKQMFMSHTERFEPPMWEDIKRFYGFSFYGNVIDELYHREEYRFFVDKLAAITVVDISKKQPFRDVYSAYATKENYEKACEMVRDLFNKGGAK